LARWLVFFWFDIRNGSVLLICSFSFFCHRSPHRSNIWSHDLWLEGFKGFRVQHGSKAYKNWARFILLCLWPNGHVGLASKFGFF
jgi:hypothetical protein